MHRAHQRNNTGALLSLGGTSIGACALLALASAYMPSLSNGSASIAAPPRHLPPVRVPALGESAQLNEQQRTIERSNGAPHGTDMWGLSSDAPLNGATKRR
ncbi:MAG: hypothetical protein IT503_00195 [Burkholderiaceae bacterium]|nr:MAG: hypothetical protein F9K36_15920 [Burkholderiaceae bacterium]MCC7284575.1 hypothetical protein [Burkholderiaceae bacterium]